MSDIMLPFSVAIIGNSGYEEKHNCETVVRINSEKDCDILFYDGFKSNKPFEKLNENTRHVCCYGWRPDSWKIYEYCTNRYPRRFFEIYLTQIKGINMPLMLDECYPCLIEKEMETRPLTGMIALYWVMNQNVVWRNVRSRVFITGMDFYDNSNSRIGSHDISKNKKWFKNFVKNHPSIELDKKLQKIYCEM